MNNYNNLSKIIENLSNTYKYKKLRTSISNRYRKLYKNNIPPFLKDNNIKLYSINGTLLSNGYDRIVIGDYGAYIEINDSQINKKDLICPPEQKYRYSKRYKNCKYYWLSLNDNSGIKIYHQKNTVTYADYKVGYYYVSVYEVKDIDKKLEYEFIIDKQTYDDWIITKAFMDILDKEYLQNIKQVNKS